MFNFLEYFLMGKLELHFPSNINNFWTIYDAYKFASDIFFFISNMEFNVKISQNKHFHSKLSITKLANDMNKNECVYNSSISQLFWGGILLQSDQRLSFYGQNKW